MGKKKKKYLTVEESHSFLESFKASLKKEKNELARVLMQENYISLKIIVLLNALAILEFDALHVVKKVIDDKVFKRELKIKNENFLCGLRLERRTLGQLQDYVKNSNLKAFEEGQKLIELLPAYTKKRNEITHEMLYRRKTMEEIETTANDVYQKGEKIIISLDVLSELISQAAASAGVVGLGSGSVYSD